MISIQERAFEYACRIVKLVEYLEKRSRSHVISNQLLRSGTSVGANLHEAQSAHTKPDFTHKCSVALKEARESHYWLRLLVATQRVSPKRLDNLLDEANQIVAILTTIVKKASVRR